MSEATDEAARPAHAQARDANFGYGENYPKLCPACHGSGEQGRRGESVNPWSGMLVPDPQMDETGPCAHCHGTGAVDETYEPPTNEL